MERPDPLAEPPRRSPKRQARGDDSFPDVPMRVNPITFAETGKGHLELGISHGAEYHTCGRTCTFEFAAKQGWNMERATPVEDAWIGEGGMVPHDMENPPAGTHYIKEHPSEFSEPGDEIHEGRMFMPTAHGKRCVNCGKATP